MALVILLFVLPPVLPLFAPLTDDPAPGIFSTKAEARNLDCERLSEIDAHRRFPGTVSEPAPRGTYIETDAMACRARIMEDGDRPPRDEAILQDLSVSAAEIVEAALVASDRNATWLVEAFYPDLSVGTKIAFATKTALAERGRRVSDRAPLLAAGDLLVLGRMTPLEAYPIACARYAALGSLVDGEVLLAPILTDLRATILHAGVCSDGTWRWLR